MRSRAALTIALAAATACQGAERRAEPSEPPPPAEDPAPAPEPVPEPRPLPAGPPTVVGTDLTPDAVLEHLRDGPAQRYRPVGRGGDLVFELELEGPVDALFVPDTEDDPVGWSREIAAWRVARCIGLDQVPPAARRDVLPDEIHDRLDPAFADLWDELEERIRWNEDGTARGAAILLVRELRPSGLGPGRRLDRWRRHLAQGVPPDPDRRRVHADLADMLLFDYLLANTARFDHGVDALPGLERLVFREHRDAFAPPDPQERETLRESMAGVEKLTAPWADGLPACDDEALSALLRDGDGGHLIEPRELLDLVDRRRTLLSHAAALVDAFGREDVVVLP